MHGIISKIVLIMGGLILLSAILPAREPAPLGSGSYTAPQQTPEIAVMDKNASTTGKKTTALKTATTTQPQKPKLPAVKSIPLPVKPAVAPKTLIPLEELNTTVRAALVNILCTTKSGGDFNPISGSGIIISDKGVILTNAHVAQYLLLKDYSVKNFVSCVARTGSPAVPYYNIDLLYFPENWLAENAKMIKQADQLGTGENDYAFLIITGPAGNLRFPNPLPHVKIDSDQNNITGDVPVLLAGYPSGLLGGIETQRELWLASSPAFLTKLFYFKDNGNIDAFSVGSNIVAQKGVSGGAAVNQWSGKVQGILTTITEGETTGERELSATSVAHIERSFMQNTGKSLSEFLGSDLDSALKDFTENKRPALTKILTDVLKATSTPAY